MRWFLPFLALLPFASAVAQLPACGGNSCNDLAVYCGDCPSEAYKTSCQEIVTANNQTRCSQEIPNFRTACPEPEGSGGSSSSSSSDGGASSTAGSGGTTSTGGSGATASTGGSGGTASTGGSGGTASTGGAGGT